MERLPAYQLIAFAQVFKARLDGIEDVAVKLLHSEEAEQAQTSKFVDEIRIIMRCNNANIVAFKRGLAQRESGISGPGGNPGTYAADLFGCSGAAQRGLFKGHLGAIDFFA